MILLVCSVRDSALDAFMRPIFVPTAGMAVRSFQDEVKNPDSPMAKHPEDYALFELGTFDEESGKLVNLPSPRQLVRGSDVKESVDARRISKDH